MRMEVNRNRTSNTGHREVRLGISEVNPECRDFNWNLFYRPCTTERQRVNLINGWANEILQNIIMSMQVIRERRPAQGLQEAGALAPPRPRQEQGRRNQFLRYAHAADGQVAANFGNIWEPIRIDPQLQPLPQLVMYDEIVNNNNDEREENPGNAPIEP